MDRTTKIVLGLIAAGLWANAALQLRAIPAHAQDANFHLSSIDNKIGSLVDGVCINRRLCGP